jgi:hypothetical protein
MEASLLEERGVLRHANYLRREIFESNKMRDAYIKGLFPYCYD